MLNPSIDSLLTKINSKYTLVTISARRARQLRDEPETKNQNIDTQSPNFVGQALEEIDNAELTYKQSTMNEESS